MSAAASKDKENYTAEEAQRRFEATLKGALNTPPKKKGPSGTTAPKPKKETKTQV